MVCVCVFMLVSDFHNVCFPMSVDDFNNHFSNPWISTLNLVEWWSFFYILGRGGYVGVTSLTCCSNKLRSLYVWNKILCISLLLSRTIIHTISLHWGHVILAQWTSLAQCFGGHGHHWYSVWWPWSTLAQWTSLAQWTWLAHCFGGHDQYKNKQTQHPCEADYVLQTSFPCFPIMSLSKLSPCH